ncbi:MAG: transporter [Candidatus Rokubacteria bacterium]|nr:transporter [Candidatus Rokubacteria bacterium]
MARAPGWTVLAIALMGLLALPLHARGEDGAIEPDRPDVTNGVKTVPPGAFQIETGAAYSQRSIAASHAEGRLAVETTLRAGLTERLEMRLDGEPFVRLRGEEDDTSHGDLTLGLKYRVLDGREGQWFPALGIQPFVKVPIADAPIGSERPDVGLIALASFDLPWELGLDANAGMAAIGQSRPSGYLLQALVSASLSRPVTTGLTTFAEIFFASRDERDSRERVGLDAGIVWRLERFLAIDAAATTSLAGPVPDFTLRTGVSVRLGR